VRWFREEEAEFQGTSEGTSEKFPLNLGTIPAQKQFRNSDSTGDCDPSPSCSGLTQSCVARVEAVPGTSVWAWIGQKSELEAGFQLF
jgi:hypothetical protein